MKCLGTRRNSGLKKHISAYAVTNPLKEVASVFFKLGCIAFGGPAAQIALMHKVFVEDRKWLTEKQYLSLSANHLFFHRFTH